MKIVIRAFALALVATGAAASLHASSSNSTSPITIAGKISSPPVPMCPPKDPNACGIQKLGW